jgi:hypothetical protein
VRAADPLKLFAPAFVTCHDIVKGENNEPGKDVPVFPDALWCSRAQPARDQIDIAAFSRIWGLIQERMPPRPIVPEDGVGGVHALPGCASKPVRPAEPTASWSSRFGVRAVGARAASTQASVPKTSAHPDFHRDPDQVGMVLGT